MNNYSDAIVVKITGGLGNQLFGLAAGLSQAQRLDCRLVLDASGYIDSGTRKFELADLGYEVIYHSGSTDAVGRLFLRNKKKLKVFKESSFNYDPSINQVVPGTMLVGYFQSPRYFENVSDQVSSLIRNEPSLTRHSNADERTKSGITMHIRRGDYLNDATRKFHGLASIDYFNRSLRLLSSSTDENQVKVFTDSPEQIDFNFFDSKLDFQFADNAGFGNFQTLNLMSQSKCFIMSNSSFSWWGAWLMNLGHPKGTVIAPRPWFASGEAAHDLLLPDWITLDAR